MKSWNSAFDAHRSREIITAVVSVIIYVAAMEALSKKERKIGWNSITNKTDRFLSLTPPLNANVRFLYLFLQPHPVYDQTQGSGTFFSLLYLHLYDQCFRISHVIALALSPDTSLYCPDTNFLPYCTLFGCVIDTKRHISVFYRKM